jgi:DeoR family suf operon transcriptional repressor
MTAAGPETPPTLPPGRRSVLYAVRRRGEATAEQVAEQLGMTVSGARQHLSALADDGLVDVAELAPQEAKRGRRTLLYSATPAADAFFPKAYGELTNELLGYVAESDAELLDELFTKRREQRIEGARGRIAKRRSLRAQVTELTKVLDEDGYFASCEETAPGVFVVVVHACP